MTARRAIHISDLGVLFGRSSSYEATKDAIIYDEARTSRIAASVYENINSSVSRSTTLRFKPAIGGPK